MIQKCYVRSKHGFYETFEIDKKKKITRFFMIKERKITMVTASSDSYWFDVSGICEDSFVLEMEKNNWFISLCYLILKKTERYFENWYGNELF